MQLTTLTFGVGPSIWHWGAMIRHHLSNYIERYPDLVKKIKSSLYADDYSGGDYDDEKAIEQYQKTKEVFKDANMITRKSKSNSPTVMEVIQKEEGGNERKPRSKPRSKLDENY